MSYTEITSLPLNEIHSGIRKKRFSCVEVMQAFLKNVSLHNEKLNAIVTIDEEHCMTQAKMADEKIARKQDIGVLHAIPIGVKDNYKTADYPTTACSDVLKYNEKDKFDAPIIKQLKDQGAIVMAKTNMHEWAFGATNEISNIGPTKNPWKNEHITGGSSGGSGAGVAAEMFPCALGSDTGGSIRIPSSACGLSGLKPTYGLISKEEVYPLSFSLDVVGPMAKNLQDLDVLFEAMIKKDMPRLNKYQDLKSLKGLRVGIPVGSNFERNEEIDILFCKAVRQFEDLGVFVDSVKIPFMLEGRGAWKVILYAEATAYHQNNLRRSPEKFSKNVRIMLESGEFISATEYLKAYQFRSVFIQEFYKIFKKFDALLFTTLPVSPPKIGDGKVRLLEKTISSQDSMTYLAWLANYLGFPQISIPCGLDKHNLPVGLAIMLPPKEDFKLLRIAALYQQAAGHDHLKPKLYG